MNLVRKALYTLYLISLIYLISCTLYLQFGEKLYFMSIKKSNLGLLPFKYIIKIIFYNCVIQYRQLASGSGDTTVRFWDLSTETPLHNCQGFILLNNN